MGRCRVRLTRVQPSQVGAVLCFDPQPSREASLPDLQARIPRVHLTEREPEGAALPLQVHQTPRVGLRVAAPRRVQRALLPPLPQSTALSLSPTSRAFVAPPTSSTGRAFRARAKSSPPRCPASSSTRA